MVNIETILDDFLKEQKKRMKERTYRNYAEVIELFQIYLNGYAYQYLSEDESEKFQQKFETDEDSFVKIFDIEKVDFSTYSEFFEYFIIRKVMAGESFMKKAVTIMKKLTKWL